VSIVRFAEDEADVVDVEVGEEEEEEEVREEAVARGSEFVDV